MAQVKQGANRTGGSGTTKSWFDQIASWKQDLICIGAMWILLLVLFNGIVFKDLIFSDSGDTAAHESWVAAMKHIQETEQTDALWIPYIFSGMPVSGALLFPKDVNYVQECIIFPISKVLFFGSKMFWMLMPFLFMGCTMYFFGRTLKFSPLISLFAALVMMLNPYAVGLPETGHGSKLIVLGYIPLLFLLTYTLMQRRSLLSLGLLSAAVGTMLLARHPQMALYGLMIIGLYTLYELIYDVRKSPGVAITKGGMFAVAVILGFAIYAYHALPTLEYAQYSIRGSGGEAGATGGLSYDYATNWSFHPFEMINLLIPSFFGFENPYYWGWMPFTNSTVYVGLVPLLLAGVAIAFRRTRFTWFLLGITVFFFFVSFGKHFSLVYDLLFNYLPYFNKLRIPVMILHVLPLTMGLLAAFGLSYILEFVRQAKAPDLEKWRKSLVKLVLVAGGILIIGMAFNNALFSMMPGGMFQKEGELGSLRQQYGGQASQALSQLKQARFDLLWKDYVKFTLLAGVAIGLLIAFLKRKMHESSFILALIVLTVIDLAIYDERYITPKPESASSQPFASDPTLARLREEARTTPFRVFDPSGQLDQENKLMFNLIESVDGYSPAKLKIYQEMRDSCFRTGNSNVFSMLNVKYLVSPRQAEDGSVHIVAQPMPAALPRAWFVDSIQVARSKQEVFATLNDATWNPRSTAILEKKVPVGMSSSIGATASITSHASRDIVINATTSSAALLVLSEIYYPAGWKAFIDGSETEIFKTNYILRSVVVPAGTHVVEFKFEPQSFQAGLTVTNAAWGGVATLILISLILVPGVRRKLGLKSVKSGDSEGGTQP